MDHIKFVLALFFYLKFYFVIEFKLFNNAFNMLVKSDYINFFIQLQNAYFTNIFFF